MPLPNILQHVYKNHDWALWRFKFVPTGYWNEINHQRACLDGIGQQLNVRTLEDWRRVTCQDFKDVGASGLLDRHGGSLVTILESVYPNYTWESSKRAKSVPWGYWRDDNVKTNFLKQVQEILNITTQTDWYTVSKGDIVNIGGSGAWRYYRRTLALMYPTVRWRWSHFSLCAKRSRQRNLLKCTKKMVGIAS